MPKFWVTLLLLATAGPCAGQHFVPPAGQAYLYFRKNGHREAIYQVGDVLTFALKGTNRRISEQIKGFDDSLLVFQYYKVNPREIAALYVDDKTRLWFILRYKYEKLFLAGGAGFLPISAFNTGRIEPRAAAISGGLLGAALLAHWLISQKIAIKGRRRLLILS